MRVALAAVALIAVAGSARAGGGTYVSDPASNASGDAYEAELREPVRFVIGFDFGLGVLGGLCDECDRSLGGVGVDVYSGVQITRRLALLADVTGVVHLLPADDPDSRGFASHTLVTAAARFWIVPELWLQWGVGAGLYRVEVRRNNDTTEIAPGTSFAIGRELDHKPDRSVNLSVRIGLGRYTDDEVGKITLYNIAAVVGWNWL